MEQRIKRAMLVIPVVFQGNAFMLETDVHEHQRPRMWYLSNQFVLYTNKITLLLPGFYIRLFSGTWSWPRDPVVRLHRLCIHCIFLIQIAGFGLSLE